MHEQLSNRALSKLPKVLSAKTLFRDRAERFAFFGLLDAANGFFTHVLYDWRLFGPGRTVLELGGISAVCWFALFVIGAIGLEESRPEPVGRFDSLILGGMVLAALVPFSIFASCALLIAGGYLFQTSQVLSRSRRIGMMFLALTGTLIWGRLLLELVPSLLLDLDANLAGKLARVRVTGNIMFNHGAVGSVAVYPGCSSVHNMSLAIVLWASLICALSLRPNTVLVLAGGVAVLSMVIVNIIRLAAMVYYPAHFEFLHTGFGGDLFGFASLLLAGLIIGYGIVIATRAQA